MLFLPEFQEPSALKLTFTEEEKKAPQHEKKKVPEVVCYEGQG